MNPCCTSLSNHLQFVRWHWIRWLSLQMLKYSHGIGWHGKACQSPTSGCLRSHVRLFSELSLLHELSDLPPIHPSKWWWIKLTEASPPFLQNTNIPPKDSELAGNPCTKWLYILCWPRVKSWVGYKSMGLSLFLDPLCFAETCDIWKIIPFISVDPTLTKSQHFRNAEKGFKNIRKLLCFYSKNTSFGFQLFLVNSLEAEIWLQGKLQNVFFCLCVAYTGFNNKMCILNSQNKIFLQCLILCPILWYSGTFGFWFIVHNKSG